VASSSANAARDEEEINRSRGAGEKEGKAHHQDTKTQRRVIAPQARRQKSNQTLSARDFARSPFLGAFVPWCLRGESSFSPAPVIFTWFREFAAFGDFAHSRGGRLAV
jgi:hypothetical protein